MTCPGDRSFGRHRLFQVFRNWARTRRIIIPNELQPTTVEQLVAAVEETENNNGVIRAFGSGWSYTDVAITDEVTHMVDTSALNNVLTNVVPVALRDEMVALTTPAGINPFVHVEAGIKIHEVNCALDGLGLAMLTLGGSNGQSLAGVISTSTHGADVNLNPIPDSIRAIHLVGPGGQEWWIEREGDDAITDPVKMGSLVDDGVLCSDIRIEYDNNLFNAVVVSMGRMGIIYSVVIKAVDAFNLRETRTATLWNTTAQEISDDIINTADDYLPSCYLEVVVNPYLNPAGDHNVVATRRTVTTDAVNTEPTAPGPFEAICDMTPLTPILAGLAASLPGIIITATSIALAGISWMLGIPFIGGILYAAASTTVIATATTALIALETALISALATAGENLSEKLANLINLAVTAGQRAIVPQLVDAMIQNLRGPGGTPPVRESYRISTGQQPCGSQWTDSPECLRRIDGLEFALDASPRHMNVFDFMNDVFALTEEFSGNNRPPAFAVSLRFTRATRSLLGMQQFNRTCSIEFMLLRGVNGHNAFIERLYEIANRRGAIPHWGLIHDMDGVDVARLYGEHHSTWRQNLGRLINVGGGNVSTFSTRFSRERALEPLPGCTIPSGLMDVFRVILGALGRSREMDKAAKKGKG